MYTVRARVCVDAYIKVFVNPVLDSDVGELLRTAPIPITQLSDSIS